MRGSLQIDDIYPYPYPYPSSYPYPEPEKVRRELSLQVHDDALRWISPRAAHRVRWISPRAADRAGARGTPAGRAPAWVELGLGLGLRFEFDFQPSP